MTWMPDYVKGLAGELDVPYPPLGAEYSAHASGALANALRALSLDNMANGTQH